MIENIKSQSRITEVDAMASQMLTAYQTSGLTGDENLVLIMNKVTGYSINLSIAIKRIKRESELEEKDQLRDQAVKNLYHLVKGNTHHPDESIKNAAVKVMDVLGHYGLEITRKSYASASSLINSLLQELDKPSFLEMINLLSGATESIQAVKTTQQDFEASHLTYEKEKAVEGTYENASAIKKQLIKLINSQLVLYLKVMSQVNEAVYGEFTRFIAQIITDNNERVKKRSNKAPEEVGSIASDELPS